MSCEQMPNYPDPSKFVRLFKYESSDSPRSTGHWVLGSTPGSVAGAAPEQEGTGWEAIADGGLPRARPATTGSAIQPLLFRCMPCSTPLTLILTSSEVRDVTQSQLRSDQV